MSYPWQRWTLIAVFLTLVVGFARLYSFALGNADDPSHSRVASALRMFDNMNAQDLRAMPALPVKRFVVPEPGVDFMRARVEEIYEIDGVGTDRVELSGWIAVRHDRARAAPGQREVRWGTAQIDTEFLGLKLTGRSALFGRVEVRLDRSRRSLGIVGYWPRDNVPEQARMLEQIYASVTSNGSAEPLPRGGCAPDVPQSTPGTATRQPGSHGDEGGILNGEAGSGTPDVGPQSTERSAPGLVPNFRAKCDCGANLYIIVTLPDLGIELRTRGPVYMHSAVETIPPVGYTATISLTPTELLNGEHVAGTLRHAAVRFRELVYHVPLEAPDKSRPIVAAAR